MQILRLSKEDKFWDLTIAYAKTCSWVVVGKHLAKQMEENQLSDWEAIFIAKDDEDILGFCTFLKEDYYPENRYSPWISTIFVDERVRGNRLSGKLIEAATIYAKSQGFSKVFIPSDMRGFYEKFGFSPIDSLKNYAGDFDTIFMKEV